MAKTTWAAGETVTPANLNDLAGTANQGGIVMTIPNTDLNLVDKAGLFVVTEASSTNTPGLGNGLLTSVVTTSGSQRFQRFHAADQGRVAVRSWFNNTWTAWRVFSPDGTQVINHTTTGNVPLNALVTPNMLVKLSANVTGAVLSNAIAGNHISITFEQDQTGGRTYVWPAGAKFAGGVAPNDTAAGKRTTVRFHYDGTNLWEVSRAVAVG